MLIIAERINASRRPIKEALIHKNEQFFLDEAKALVERGSHFLDLNTSRSPETELKDLLWLIDLLKPQVEIPFSLDSSTPAVIEAGLKRIGKPGQMINSTTLEPAKLEKILPLAQEYQASLVVLLMDENTPANTADRLRQMERLAELVERGKIPKDRIFADVLVFTLSTEVKNGLHVLQAIRELKKHWPEFKTLAGLSNISYGLPNRRLLNRVFLAMALAAGLDAALIDPLDDELMAVLKAGLALTGQDRFCLNYLEAFRRGELGK